MKRKYIWLIEIVVWLLIVSGSLFFFIYKTTIKDNVQNTYYIFFDDVEGLVKGSPVRLMGINVGYVRNVKIFDNKVFVSLLVTKENVVLPRTAKATIEFYGLGGSTSLELNPAYISTNEDKEEIIPAASYRVQDFWDGQKLVANVMIDIYGGIGRTIQNADLLNHKDYLKQNRTVQNLLNYSESINTTQSVIIYRLSEQTLPYINKRNQEKLMELEAEKNAFNEKDKEVLQNE